MAGRCRAIVMVAWLARNKCHRSLSCAQGRLIEGGTYLGAHARLVEEHLGLLPEDILYIGDHLYADVHITKHVLRWRTALVLRDLENELEAVERFAPKQRDLSRLMAEKEQREHQYSRLRLEVERSAPPREAPGSTVPVSARSRPGKSELRRRMQSLRSELTDLDERIAPLAREAGELHSERWGLLMRAGADKSYLARQVGRRGRRGFAAVSQPVVARAAFRARPLATAPASPSACPATAQPVTIRATSRLWHTRARITPVSAQSSRNIQAESPKMAEPWRAWLGGQRWDERVRAMFSGSGAGASRVIQRETAPARR